MQSSADRLTFLVDTNVFLTLEPHQELSTTDPYELAARLARLIQDNGHRLAVHEGTRKDIERGTEPARRAHREQALRKYRLIEGVPLSQRVTDAIPGESASDRVDALIASALEANAAHFLVTEDRRLRRRIQRALPELSDRILSLAEAVEWLDAFHPEPKTPPPLVERVPCYLIGLSDPIFDSIRADYAPHFDEWYEEKCQRGQREAFVIRGEDGSLAGLCILKDEDDREYDLPPKRMKLCTLKVTESYRGQRLGELLVKAALDDAIERRLSGLSVTVFDRHEALIGLLEDLGFEDTGARTDLDELVYFRSLQPPPEALTSLEPFEFNRRFGPRALNIDVPIHVVPIQPQWEERLFPEGRLQLELLEAYAACGNGLRKAYLSRSLNRRVRRGDILLFYRSQDERAVRFVAVVEDTLASTDSVVLGRFVGTRTVYSVEEITEMTEKGKHAVNAILMRQARQLEPSWRLSQLQDHGVFERPPQSIQSVPERGARWVRAQLAV